jgi:DNA repair exonuclease SbcCD ATPase subunit
MIFFREVRYKNIMATGQPFTVIRLDAAPTTLFTGKNGSGKSTFIEAITFALFNQAYRKINKPALVNTINNKNLLCEIDFDIGPTKYTVRRGIKPAVFEIEIDGKVRDSVPGTDDQKWLEEVVLGMNFKTFCQTVIIGNATYTPFMQLSTPNRRDFVEDLLDIRIYGLMTDILKKKVSDAKQRIKDIEDELRVQSSKIDVQKSYIQTLHDDRERKAAQAREKIAASQVLIDQANKDMDAFVGQRDELMDKVQDSEAVSERMKKLKPLASKLVENVTKLREEIAFFEQHDDCPVCKQMINDEFKSSAIEERNTKVFHLKDGSLKLREQIDATQERLDEIFDLNQSIRRLDQTIADCMTKIRIEQRVIDRLQAELNVEQQITANVDHEEAKLKSLAAAAVQMSEAKTVATEDKFYLDLQALMLKDTGIKANVIKQYVPIMNKMINKYLNALDFFASFNLDENFSEVIKSRNRDVLQYESFSEGEKLKIDLSILFTWIAIAKMKNTVSTNLLIFDEVTDAGLDNESSGHIVGILKDLAKSAHVFVISHHPELYSDKFDRHVKFAKVNNYSLIVD